MQLSQNHRLQGPDDGPRGPHVRRAASAVQQNVDADVCHSLNSENGYSAYWAYMPFFLVVHIGLGNLFVCAWLKWQVSHTHVDGSSFLAVSFSLLCKVPQGGTRHRSDEGLFLGGQSTLGIRTRVRCRGGSTAQWYWSLCTQSQHVVGTSMKSGVAGFTLREMQLCGM